MPKYRLKKDHFLQTKRAGAKPEDKNVWDKEPQLHEAGTEVDFEGAPSLHMEGVDKEAKARCSERQSRFEDKRKRAQARGASVGWSPAYEANMAAIAGRRPPAPTQQTAKSA